jgi:HEAT repeat protein
MASIWLRAGGWAAALLAAAAITSGTARAAGAEWALAPALAAAVTGADGPPGAADEESDDDPDDETPAQRAEERYQEGTDALDEERWERAVEAFDEVARMGGARVDGALYWKAYALAKSGRKAEAMATVAELRRTAPASRWLKEAQALEMEVKQASGQRPSPESVGDEELKLIALNALLAADADRAVPMLEGFLSSNSSRKLRDRALFVLTQTSDPRARAIVTGVARGERHVDLQRNAIRYLAMFGGRESHQALRQIYSSSQDQDIKKAVLQAYMINGDKAQVLAAARDEKSPELRRAAIQHLGAMGAQDELWELYRGETAVEVKKHILHGLFIGGGEARLMEVVRTESQPELRRAAVRNLGLMGSPRTAELLVTLYRTDPDPRLRRQAVEGLFIGGNAEALVQLARAEKDPTLRKELVSKLSLMHDKVAVDYMLELLK